MPYWDDRGKEGKGEAESEVHGHYSGGIGGDDDNEPVDAVGARQREMEANDRPRL